MEQGAMTRTLTITSVITALLTACGGTATVGTSADDVSATDQGVSQNVCRNKGPSPGYEVKNFGVWMSVTGSYPGWYCVKNIPGHANSGIEALAYGVPSGGSTNFYWEGNCAT